jgi:hypothetical protein
MENKHKKFTFPANLKKNCGPTEIRIRQISFRFISGEPNVKSIKENFSIELFCWPLILRGKGGRRNTKNSL